MNVVKAGYKILSDIDGMAILKGIERAARECYKSSDRITEDGESAKRMVKMLIKNHHDAMLEHGGMISVLFNVDRGVSHELVRHRMASFAQESTRFCNYGRDKFENQINVIDPTTGLELDTNSYDADHLGEIYTIWRDAMEKAEYYYLKLIDCGVTPQMARSVLPNSTKTGITVTANIREWRHIFALRAVGTTGKPHPQMQEVMVPLLKELHEKVPIVFDDLYKQLEEK